MRWCVLLAVAISVLIGAPQADSAQPDYPNAKWSSAYPGHWYTSGNGHYFVVEHDMEGYYLATISYFQQSGTQASIHYCVNSLQNGSDNKGHAENNPNDSPAGEITQMVEERYWAWHVLCWNRWTFGTEHEGFVSTPVWYSDAMYQASGALTRYLCDKYNIPKDRNHVIGHNEWQNPTWVTWMSNNWPQIDPTCNNHTDPGQYWDWSKFMAIVSGTPGISTQPWSRLVEPGSSTSFSMLPNGTGPLYYQWRKNGNNVPGATATNLILSNVQPPDAAAYSVVVSNSYGSVTSRVATLTISPIWVQTFSDNFDSDTSTNWNLFWGAGNGIPDYTTNWAFDYSTTAYVAGGATNFIPPSPSSSGTTRGLKLSVNKNDATAATAAVSLYPKSLTFSNDYTLRFDMWINYNGGAGGGSGSTEYATFGINHTGAEVNWTTNGSSSDGVWFAVDGEGGSAGTDYRAYAGNGLATASLLSFANSGMSASGATSDDGGDPFFMSLLPSPTYETSGSPGKHWIQGEVTQIGNVITWQLNGVVVAQRTNTSAYTMGDIMLGYMDPYSSIANPAADNYIIYDNVRVLISASSAALNNLTVIPRLSSALVSWTSSAPTTGRIEYGLDSSYGNFSTRETRASTNHLILLVGLFPRTNYVFRVHSFLGENELVSAPGGFSTDVSLILDNPDATYSGNWTIGTSSPDEYGTYFQYATTTTSPSPTSMATYAPNIITPGKYDLYIWYPQGDNRSANAQVPVLCSDGFLSYSKDQTVGGGAWQPLATALNFSAGSGGYAGIANNTGENGKIVASDAFKWVYNAAQDIPTDGSVPAWWSSYYFGSNVSGSLDPDHDGYSTYKEYVLGTSPVDSTSRFSTSIQRAGSALQVNFAPCLGGRAYELQWTTNLASGVWQTVSSNFSASNAQGSFALSSNSSSGPQFYRIAVHLTP